MTRVAIVTGGASGFGTAIAGRLRADGLDLPDLDVTDETLGEDPPKTPTGRSSSARSTARGCVAETFRALRQAEARTVEFPGCP